MEFLKNIWTWIKKHPIISIIAIAIILYFVYKAIDGKIKRDRAKKNYNATVSQAQTAITQLANQGVIPSYAQSQFSSWADEIQVAFTGCGAGWLVVKRIFEKMKNDADVYALIQNFGTRTIDECGWGSREGDLSALIAYKFSGYRFCDCIPIISCDGEHCGSTAEINKVLKSKGITVSF